MGYAFQGHETEFAGHLFRSRLEARWAAMFNALGWRWTYEPFDLPGWSPDFLLHALDSAGQDVLVEVKGPESEIEPAKEKASRAISVSGCDHDVLILGPSIECLQDTSLDAFETSIGLLGERYGGDLAFDFALITEFPEGGYDFCHASNSYKHRLTGFYDGSPCMMTSGQHRELLAMWGFAHKQTRYNPRKGGR